MDRVERIPEPELTSRTTVSYFFAVSNEAAVVQDEARSVRGVILSLLRDLGPTPRIELARKTGLSPTTITRATVQLIDDEIVVEGNSVSVTGLGRRATELTLRRTAYFVVGVQIGVGFVQLGIVDLLGEQHAATSFEYDIQESPNEVLRRVASAIDALVRSNGTDRRLVVGIGVAVPGPVDASGRRMLLPINLHWRDVNVADQLEAALGLPVTVEHNVRSMALAETRFGRGRGLGSLAFVYLRTGLGAGLVVEGEPFAGGVHGAIELGHLQVADNDVRCVCGNAGCLETVVSERALRATIAAMGLDDTPNPLSALWEARTTSARAATALDEIIASLAKGLSALANLLNPELILLGGALADVPDGFVERVREETRAAVFPVLRPSLEIHPSSLGMDAGVLGGATVALDTYFYN